MDSELVKGTEKVVSNEVKWEITTKALRLVAANPQIIVSGSLSSLIFTKQQAGVSVLEPTDLATINDIDLGLTDLRESREIKNNFAGLTSGQEFGIEVEPILQNCIYSQDTRSLAVQWAVVRIGEEEVRVQYTTPAFLLLSLVDGGVGEKTPAEKIKRKIQLIQNLPGFSPQDFVTLAKNDIKARFLMNADTFRYWQRNLLEELAEGNSPFEDLLAKNYENVSSLVDQAHLLNCLKGPDDVKKMEYVEVRKVTDLEMFLAEFEGHDLEKSDR